MIFCTSVCSEGTCSGDTRLDLQAQNRSQRINLINRLLSALAHDPLPDRPHRVEPRVQKKRPKAFPFLCQPRQILKVRLLGPKNRKKYEP